MSKRFSMRRSVLFLVLCLPVAAVATAQSTVTTSSANDSLFKRARRLVSEGNGAAGRALVDTLLSHEQEGRPGYGEALYWRGALAETAADAERDYRRVIVEYPLSAYADDALLAMAELEQARGDRASALQHLQRFVREHPVSTARGTAAFAGARLAFELGDTRAGCNLISDARSSVATNEIELRNQIDYYAARCPSTVGAVSPAQTPATPSPARDTSRVAATTQQPSPTRQPKVTVPMTPPAKTATVASPMVPTPATPSTVAATAPTTTVAGKAPDRKLTTMFTVQLAAYNTLADAQALVARLEKKGVHARVSGTAKPFRVRLALHSTRQAALDDAAALKAKSIIGFVTDEQIAEPKAP
jgi:cell division septation protein DedD